MKINVKDAGRCCRRSSAVCTERLKGALITTAEQLNYIKLRQLLNGNVAQHIKSFSTSAFFCVPPKLTRQSERASSVGLTACSIAVTAQCKNEEIFLHVVRWHRGAVLCSVAMLVVQIGRPLCEAVPDLLLRYFSLPT